MRKRNKEHLGLNHVVSGEVRLLFGELDVAFKSLKGEILKIHKNVKDNPDIERLHNLFRGFKAAARKGKRTFIHPTKILDYKNPKGLNLKPNQIKTVQQSMSKMSRKIEQIYKINLNKAKFKFYIVPAYRKGSEKGSYELEVTVTEEGEEKDFFDIIGVEKTQISSIGKEQLEEKRSEILSKYRMQVEKDYRYLETEHLQMIPIPKNSIEIDNMYIPLRATKEVPLSEALYITEQKRDLIGVTKDFLKERRIIEKSSFPLTIEQIMKDTFKEKDTSKRHMVFLGLPGSGKTTLLRYLVYSIASDSEKAQEWGFKGVIPFFINLRDYVDKGEEDLIQYCLSNAVENVGGDIKRNYIKGILGDFIEACKENSQGDSRIIFLLDSLDETRGEKEQIVREIGRLRNRYKNNFIIVTSRITGYYDVPLSGFTPYLIEDLQIEEEIPSFVKKWFEILAVERSKEDPDNKWNEWALDRTNHLIGQIENKPGLRRIATTPLYLTFLVFLASDPDTALPETRCELYDLYFQKLFLKWEEKYEEPLPLNEGDLFRGLKEISWIIHRSLFGDINSDTTDGFIKDSIKNSVTVDIDKLFNFWLKAGVFHRVQTRSYKELILPRHLSFLEYGFACKLAELWDNEKTRKALQKDLKRNLHNEYLREPLLIFVGKLKNPITFIEYVRNLKDDFFHSNLIFLCKAIREISNSNKFELKGIINGLLSRLQEILYSSIPFSEGVRSDICKCMYLLGGNETLKALLKEESGLSFIIEWLVDIAPLCDKSTIPLFKEILEKVNKKEDIERIIECIAIVGGEETLSFLLELFEKKSAMRRGIVNAIIISMGKNATAILKKLHEKYEIDILLDKDILVTIGKLGDVQYGITELVKRFNAETTLWSRIKLTGGIAELRDEIGIYLLKKIYEEENDLYFRQVLIDVACNLESSILIQLFKQLISIEQDISMREKIAYFIARRKDKSIIPYLKDFYEKEIDYLQKSEILYAFGEVADMSDIPYLRKIFDMENNNTNKVYIARALGKGGDIETAIELLKDLFRQSEDFNQVIISDEVVNFGKEKLAITQLNEIFKERYPDHPYKDVIVKILRNAVVKGQLLVYYAKKGRWKLIEIPKQYSFRSLSICNCHNQDLK